MKRPAAIKPGAPSASTQTLSPTQLARRWRRRRLAIIGIIIGALVALSWFDHQGWFLHLGGDMTHYDGRSFAVVSVSADSLAIDVPDERFPTTQVRLLGIANIADIAVLDDEHRDLVDVRQAMMRELASGRRVTLTLQPGHERDGKSALLALVTLPDGTSLNERLVAAGRARVAPLDDRLPQDAAWHRRLKLIEDQARLNRSGLWRHSAPSPQIDEPAP